MHHPNPHYRQLKARQSRERLQEITLDVTREFFHLLLQVAFWGAVLSVSAVVLAVISL